MPQTRTIHNHPEIIRKTLLQLKKDAYFSKTFEGIIARGIIRGNYTWLATVNGIVIGYVRVTGTYSLQKGEMQIRTSPSGLYWVVMAFVIGAGLLKAFFDGATNPKPAYVNLLIFLFAALVHLIYRLECMGFFRHFSRIYNKVTFEHHPTV